MWIGLTAPAPMRPDVPMPPDRVREALESLRASMERRLDGQEASLRQLLQQLGEHHGAFRALQDRTETIGKRVHEHGNILAALKMSVEEQKDEFADYRRGNGNGTASQRAIAVTWPEISRIALVTSAMVGGVFGLIKLIQLL